jgi:hypothetical protein
MSLSVIFLPFYPGFISYDANGNMKPAVLIAAATAIILPGSVPKTTSH